ncbi:cyclic AMP response element-binding protein B isoform X2 [Drosophila montana]|uniref:cyclic AMP response element-binding protein B isoform X2 n=1 Tax=Drosophila montana TaxID=40370 RepID=UPI00313CB335
MDSIVEENGNSASSGNVNDVDIAAATAVASAAAAASVAATGGQQQQQQQLQQNQQSTTSGVPATVNTNNASGTASVLTTAANCNIQYPILTQHGLQVQSVIQAANHSGVIQTAIGTQQQQQQQALAAASAMHKGGSGVVYMTKPANTTVIHTTTSNAVQIPPNFQCKIKPEPNTQHPEDSDESLSDDDSQHHRSNLTRRPSYNKIFTEISGPDISAGGALQMPDGNVLSSQLGSGAGGGGGGGNTSSSPLLHMAPDSAFYLSNRIAYNANNSGIAEDQTRKREIRLQKNREAARECRRKKKEYIKCLENRVAVLENQNKALIEELKSLKELYCQTKND